MGLLGLALVGCADLRPPDDSVLPTQLSILVEENDGELISAVVDLRRNTRYQIDVRVSSGLRLFDGRRLWELAPVARGSTWNLQVRDLLGTAAHDLPLGAPLRPDVLAVNREFVWARKADRVFRCALDRPYCVAAPEAERPPLDHAGPGAGFHVRLDGGRIFLVLPQDGNDVGEPILEDVLRIVGVHWVHEGFLQRNTVLDRTFRGRATLVTTPRSIVADGDLREWGESQPLVVDSPWQIDEGAEHWRGPRDASFSLSAAADGDRTCFAGRVRDDHPVPGDRLALRIGDHELVVPLDATPLPEGVHVTPEWFGARFEACTDLRPPLGAGLPFAAVLTDGDPDEKPTLLATAASAAGVALGTLRAP